MPRFALVFDIGAGEFIVILVVGLLIVGPERLPALARQWVSLMRTAREQVSRAKADLQESVGGDVADVTQFLAEADPRRILRDASDSVGIASSRRAAGVTRPAQPPAPLFDADTP